MEQVNYKKKITHNSLFKTKNCQVQRSMISPDYANRFIREFILDGEEKPKIEQKTIFDYIEE